MTRATFAPALTLLLVAPGAMPQQAPKVGQRPPAVESPKPPVIEVEPPEEDEAAKPKEYAFNPLQAEKELRIGNFYWKKKSYKAAALRYEEATKWNPGDAEAWFRLGEAREKLKLTAEARAAYEQFLELAQDDKRAPEVKKRVAKLPPPKKES
ncbi:MAG TPA: tetratricopeptide repeat protein [Bryobacteraceae bacterium]|nr:tetratricopeptide repeat protein [Bryobacteraceae bacterium]